VGKRIACEYDEGGLVELAYDLAISPLDNVSESPGFESCLRVNMSAAGVVKYYLTSQNSHTVIRM